jgi:hypothetical protein
MGLMVTMVESESNCTFVPLANYNWSLSPALIPVALPWNPTAYCLISAFCSISLWMTIELTIQVFFTFKRHKGLYFWSLLVCTWGITFHVIGLLLKLFAIGSWILSSILFKIGWVSNVTGFSLVLYSRLHLVVRDRRILRSVLAMIITDAILFHTPIIIFDFGISSPHPMIWVKPMQVMERIQVTGFAIQETIISSLYIWATSKFLKDTYTKQTHRVMLLLIFAQVVAVLFDIALITVDWDNMFTLKVTIHPFVYAVKLKIEFIVLNQLLALIKHGLAPGSIPGPDEESPYHSDPTPENTTKHVSYLSADTAVASTNITRSRDFADPRDENNLNPQFRNHYNGNNNNYSSKTLTLAPPRPIHPAPIIRQEFVADPDEITPAPVQTQLAIHVPPTITTHATQTSPIIQPQSRPNTEQRTGTPVSSTPRTSFTAHRMSFSTQHMPPRSISDPTPLNPQQERGSTDEIVTEIERFYLGSSGLRRVSMAEP